MHVRTRVSRWRLAPALALVAVGLVAACGSSTPSSSTGASASPSPTAAVYPVTVDSNGTPLVISAKPTRIVSLSPTATEDLFAVGAGEQVGALADQTAFPAPAPQTKLSGFTPNVEAIAGYKPDLVVLSDDIGGVVKGLQTLKVPVLVQPAAKDLEQAWAQLKAIGAATDHADTAATLADDLSKRLDAAVASVPASVQGFALYHELDPTLYSATSNTFVGSVEKRLGLVNIADAAAKAGNEFPQLSAEYVVKSAPQVVVLADTVCCKQTDATFAARPGFGDLPAVKESRVIGINDSIASRWGPRIVDFAEQLATALKANS